MNYFFKFRNSDQFWFNLKSANHEIVLASEGYVTSAGRDNGIESVRNNSQLDSRYERLISSDNKYYFVLKAANGEIIGKSETYNTSASRDAGIETVKRIALNAGEKDAQNA